MTQILDKILNYVVEIGAILVDSPRVTKFTFRSHIRYEPTSWATNVNAHNFANRLTKTVQSIFMLFDASPQFQHYSNCKINPVSREIGWHSFARMRRKIAAIVLNIIIILYNLPSLYIRINVMVKSSIYVCMYTYMPEILIYLPVFSNTFHLCACN